MSFYFFFRVLKGAIQPLYVLNMLSLVIISTGGVRVYVRLLPRRGRAHVHDAFFISRNFAMTSTAPLAPVAFSISGSVTLMNTLCFFSSPMVNLPCVSLLAFANSSSFLTALSCVTCSANLTLPLVYSCPGLNHVSCYI